MPFPSSRPRRLRRTEGLRNMVRETSFSPENLIQPFFVTEGEGVRQEIGAMPGQSRLSIDNLVTEARAAQKLGVGGVILFGIPSSKDATGTSGYDPDGIIPRALRALAAEVPGLLRIADVCLCEYTDHGHCGVVRDGEVLNDETLPLLAKAATVYADAGADIIAPSDMMDGRVGAIRHALDDAGRGEVAILSYSVKYHSAYYGPFREAAGSAPQFGDRRGYQMDPGNVRESFREVTLDLEEGADAVMVKPALPYLDMIARLRDRFDVPIAAYQVSGEYAQIKAAAERGWIDEEKMVAESLLSIRRAGADMIITYFATQTAKRN